jgi:hypothetical protein
MTTPLPQPIFNQNPYLRTSRQFPTDISNLVVELNTMYNEVSTYSNLRTIGLFATNRSSITGEGWYLNSSNKQQSIRQVYTLAGPVSATTTIPHNIPSGSYTNFIRIWGTCQTSGPTGLYETLPRLSLTNITSQIRLTVGSTNINIEFGSTAPTIYNVMIVLEWLSNV